MFTYEVVGCTPYAHTMTVVYTINEKLIGRVVGYDPAESIETTKARILKQAPIDEAGAVVVDNVSGLTGEFEEGDIASAITALTPPGTQVELLNRIADLREFHERKGVTINGTFFYTDESSLIRLLGAAIESIIDPAYTLNWKTADGPMAIDGPTLIGIASKIREYTQSCFDREAVIIASVLDDTFVESDLEQGWPSNEITTD